MRRLYVKIYLTLLACLALVALATAIVFHFGEDEEDRGWSSRRDAVVAAMLPADAEPADQQLVLDRLASAFSASPRKKTIVVASATSARQASRVR